MKLINGRVLMCAAMYGLSIVKNICELGANVNNNDENNWLALFYALHNNHNHSAKVLLEYDSITNSKTKYGKRAFRFGSRETQKEFAIMVENIRFLNIKN